MPANVAPPLKSTSTRLSWSGGWVIASPSTSVRRNSDLPLPVAPTTSPCGPMPCCADSLRSRCTIVVPELVEGSLPTPIGTRNRSRADRGRHPVAGSNASMPSIPSSSGSPAGAVGTASGAAAGTWWGSSRRATASAVARSHWSRRRSSRAGRSSRSTPVVGGSSAAATSITVTAFRNQGDCGDAVDHEQQVNTGGHQVENRGSRADQPDRTDRVGPLRALGVRQPLDPLPLVEDGFVGEHGDGEVVGGVEGRAGADEGAGQARGPRRRRRPGRSGGAGGGRRRPAGPAAPGGRRAVVVRPTRRRDRRRPRPGRPVPRARRRAAGWRRRTAPAGRRGRPAAAPTPGSRRPRPRAAPTARDAASRGPGAGPPQHRVRRRARPPGAAGSCAARRSAGAVAARAAGRAGCRGRRPS